MTQWFKSNLNLFKSTLIRTLRQLALKLENKDWKKELEGRKFIVEQVVNDFIPEIYKLSNRTHSVDSFTIIKDGTFNYFEFVDKTLPKFDIVIAEISLYIIVGDPKTGTLEQANSCGFERSEWELSQTKLDSLKIGMPKLGQSVDSNPLKVIVFDWSQAVTPQTVYTKILEVLSN